MSKDVITDILDPDKKPAATVGGDKISVRKSKKGIVKLGKLKSKKHKKSPEIDMDRDDDSDIAANSKEISDMKKSATINKLKNLNKTLIEKAEERNRLEHKKYTDSEGNRNFKHGNAEAKRDTYAKKPDQLERDVKIAHPAYEKRQKNIRLERLKKDPEAKKKMDARFPNTMKKSEAIDMLYKILDELNKLEG